MSALYNLARMTTATTGTGTITLGSAVSGFLTFAGAGVPNAAVVSYGIQDGVNSEVGTGTYTTSGTTLTRTVVNSTNSNAAISLSGNAQVFITALAADLYPTPVLNGGTGVQTLTAFNVIVGNGQSAVTFAAPGTAGYPLLSNSATLAPSFAQLALTTGVTGVLPVANGGTGVSSLTAYAVLLGGTTGTGAVQSAASLGASGDVLTSNGAGAIPSFKPVSASASSAPSPQGRLTLTTGVPVMNADATAQSTIYYTPYNGNQIGIYNGATTVATSFNELSMVMASSANWASGSAYDLFVINDSSTIRLGTGPAWSSSTSRGTGAGTTELQMVNGLWTNKVTATIRYGASSTVSISANQATYVGSFYASGNGATGMQFKPSPAAGGTNNILYLYNAYNRVGVKSVSRDNTASWTYTSATWRAADNAATNRITFFDGLQQSSPHGVYTVFCQGTPGTVQLGIGIALDSTTAPTMAASSQALETLSVPDDYLPQLGLHYIQALEAAESAVSVTFYGTNAGQQKQNLIVELEM